MQGCALEGAARSAGVREGWVGGWAGRGTFPYLLRYPSPCAAAAAALRQPPACRRGADLQPGPRPPGGAARRRRRHRLPDGSTGRTATRSGAPPARPRARGLPPVARRSLRRVTPRVPGLHSVPKYQRGTPAHTRKPRCPRPPGRAAQPGGGSPLTSPAGASFGSSERRRPAALLPGALPCREGVSHNVVRRGDCVQGVCPRTERVAVLGKAKERIATAGSWHRSSKLCGHMYYYIKSPFTRS